MSDEETKAASKAPETLCQIHLRGPGYSGRAVRYRVLTPAQVDHNEKLAGESIGDKGTVYEFSNAAVKLGLETMIAQVTEAPVHVETRVEVAPDGAKKTVQVPRFDEAKWVAVNADVLCTPEGWARFFTTKDTTLLKQVYGREHTVSPADLDAVLEGKVLVVAD